MKLIVGLGNPGATYVRTRHNAGFMVVERLAARLGLAGAPARLRFHADILDAVIGGERCVMLRPQTYMNRSGLTVGEAVAFYKVDPAVDLIVLVDDIYLPLGRLRLRPSGGAAGHNGLKDVERSLGSINYTRLRIGIDAPGRVPQADYVLQRFSDEDLKTLDPALNAAADAVECWVKDGLDKAMSRFNAAEQ